MTDTSGNHRLTQKELIRERWIPAFAVMITVIITVTSAAYSVGTKIGRVEARLASLEMFAQQGDRWTAKDGLETRSRVISLEEELRELPPDWFEKQHDETRIEVRSLRVEVAELRQSVETLLNVMDHTHSEKARAGKDR